MDVKTITINFTCRLYTDEVAALQQYVGTVVPLVDDARSQNLSGVGLSPVIPSVASPDYVTISNYLSKCVLTLLEEVRPDSMVLTAIGRHANITLRNVTKPHFQWTSFEDLSVLPPVFGLDVATVRLASNDFNLIFPAVVPSAVAFLIMRNLLAFTLFSRAYAQNPGVINMADLEVRTSQITHLGKTYTLNVQQVDPNGVIQMLENVAMYSSILAAVIPSVCYVFNQSLMRHGSHELLPLYRGLIPDFMAQFQPEQNAIADDLTRLEAFLTYTQTVGSVFNLNPRLRLAAYTDETLSGTAWLL